MKKRQKGFSLVELMIVVAIISIIVSIAIVNLMRSRLQSNEAATIQNLRTICAAEIAFNAAKHKFADFSVLVSETDGRGTSFIETSWSEGVVKNGYSYSIPTATNDDFECYAEPTVPGKTGVRYFRVDTSGLIRTSATGRPTETDPEIGTG